MSEFSLEIESKYELNDSSTSDLASVSTAMLSLRGKGNLDQNTCNRCMENPAEAIEYAEKYNLQKDMQQLITDKQLTISENMATLSKNDLSNALKSLTFFSNNGLLNQDFCNQCLKSPEETLSSVARYEYLISVVLPRHKLVLPKISTYLPEEQVEEIISKIKQQVRTQQPNQTFLDTIINEMQPRNAEKDTETFDESTHPATKSNMQDRYASFKSRLPRLPEPMVLIDKLFNSHQRIPYVLR